jgi:colicin import membrane protein
MKKDGQMSMRFVAAVGLGWMVAGVVGAEEKAATLPTTRTFEQERLEAARNAVEDAQAKVARIQAALKANEEASKRAQEETAKAIEASRAALEERAKKIAELEKQRAAIGAKLAELDAISRGTATATAPATRKGE